MSGFRSLLRAMWLGFVRDRTTVFFTVVFPLMFLVIFGALFRNQSTPKLDLVVVGPSTLIDQAESQGGLAQVVDIRREADLDTARNLVAKGDADALVIQRGDQLELQISAAQQVDAGIAASIVEQIVQRANQALIGTPPKFSLTTRQVEDTSLKPIQYLTPGLLGWAIASAGVFGASQTLVTWRTKGVLRRLRLSPIRLTDVFAARITLGLGISVGQLLLFLGVATLPPFGLALRGSWWLTIPTLAAGTLAFLAIGTLIGGVAKTEGSAQAIAQLVVMPMAFLGGSFFPLDQSPRWLQTVSHIFPLRYLNEGMLNVLGRGQGIRSVWPNVAILLAIAVPIGVLALRLFRWDR